MINAPHNLAEASQKYQAVNPAALDSAIAAGRRLPGTRARLAGPLELARVAAHGAVSVTRTQVLRRGRVAPEALEARLAVCRDCPGGHATFKKSSGELHTCGPMVESLRKAGLPGGKTCGCVLKLKAGDAKEDCPFGYWPTLESKQIVRGEEPLTMSATAATAKRSVPSLITADKTLAVPRHRRGKASGCSQRRAGGVQAYSETEMREFMRRREAERKLRPFDPSRRRFIGSAAAGVAGMALASKVWAVEEGAYYKLQKCGASDEVYIARSGCSLEIGKVYEEAEPIDDPVCWEVIDCNTYTPDAGVIQNCGFVDSSISHDSCEDSACASAPCYCPNGLASSYTVNWSWDDGSNTCNGSAIITPTSPCIYHEENHPYSQLSLCGATWQIQLILSAVSDGMGTLGCCGWYATVWRGGVGGNASKLVGDTPVGQYQANKTAGSLNDCLIDASNTNLPFFSVS